VHWKNLLILSVAGIFAMVFCVFLDCKLYGQFELTPVNYYISNIIQHKAASWGIKPWWYYFYFFIVQTIPPIGVILLVFFLIGLYKKPKNVFVWCIIPFLIAHFFVDHKEMRFLFPMVFGFIYLTSIGIDKYIVSGKYKKLGRIIFMICLIINIPILIFRSIIPSQEVMSYYKFLYNYTKENNITLLGYEHSVYNLIGVNVNFYKSPNVKCIVMKNDSAITNYLNNNKPDSVFVYYENIADDKKYDGYTNERVYCLFPKWILACNINNWESRSNIWDIRKLKKIKS
jgi:phosphatidylinositol glycan class B